MKVRMLRRAGTTYQATIGNPRVVALITAAGIAVGVIAWLSGERGLANGVWSLVTAIAISGDLDPSWADSPGVTRAICWQGSGFDVTFSPAGDDFHAFHGR